jgi:hypothetical protein
VPGMDARVLAKTGCPLSPSPHEYAQLELFRLSLRWAAAALVMGPIHELVSSRAHL